MEATVLLAVVLPAQCVPTIATVVFLSLEGRCGGGWNGNGKGGMIGRMRLQPVSASWSFSELSIPTFFA